jgi:hypothetical protein
VPSDPNPMTEALCAQFLESLVARLTLPHDVVEVIALYVGNADILVRHGVLGPNPAAGHPSLWWPERLSRWSYGGTALRQRRPVIVPLPHVLPQAVALFHSPPPVTSNLALAIWVPLRRLTAVAGLFVGALAAGEAIRLAAVAQQLDSSDAADDRG